MPRTIEPRLLYHLALFFVMSCESINAVAQAWQNYLSSKSVFALDYRNGVVLAGVEHRVVAVNSVTLETELMMPSTDLNGDGVIPFREIAIDEDGAYWAGVGPYGNGIWKHSQSGWEQFTINNSNLPSNYMSLMQMDTVNHRLLLAWGQELGWFDDNGYSSIGMPSAFCSIAGDGALWMTGGAQGVNLVRYTPDSVNTYSTLDSGVPFEQIEHIQVDGSDQVWIAGVVWNTSVQDWAWSIVSFNGSQWSVHPEIDSVLASMGTVVIDLYAIPGGGIVVITPRGTIDVLDGAVTDTYLLGSLASGFPEIEATSFCIDATGTRWIGTRYDGLLRIVDDALERVALGDHPFVGNSIRTVLVDGSGVLWAGTGHDNAEYRDNSIARYDGTWSARNQILGDIPASANAMELDQLGVLHLTGADGCWKYTGNSWTQRQCPGGGALNTDITIEPSGSAWVSTPYSFLYRCTIGGGVTQHHPFGFGSNFVYSTEVDSNGDVWAGGSNMIGKRNLDGTWSLTSLGSGVSNQIKDIEFDSNGQIWAAGSSLFHFDGGSWSTIPLPENTTFSTDIELVGDGTLWVALGVHGVGRYDGSDWTVFNSSNAPFISQYVTEIALDLSEHRLWCATFHGGILSYTDEDLIMALPEAQEAGIELKLAPNPATDFVTIHAPLSHRSSGSIGVFDALGQEVLVFNMVGDRVQLDLSAVESGIYFFRQRTSDGQLAVARLVVVH